MQLGNEPVDVVIGVAGSGVSHDEPQAKKPGVDHEERNILVGRF
jgi:hypothetical protein